MMDRIIFLEDEVAFIGDRAIQLGPNIKRTFYDALNDVINTNYREYFDALYKEQIFGNLDTIARFLYCARHRGKTYDFKIHENIDREYNLPDILVQLKNLKYNFGGIRYE